jgi:hypothetical protein
VGNPEEIPNIEPFPLSPRFRREDEAPGMNGSPSVPTAQSSRPLTPLQRAKVEFWHQGEQARQIGKPTKARRYDHARRADQMGLLMMIAAAVIISVVIAALCINNKKYSFTSDSAAKTTTPVIDFYQGNQAFNRKVKVEKEGAAIHDLPSQGANEDFEISLQAQMSSMNEKLEKMRSMKFVEEAPIPQPDKGARPEPLIGVRPADIGKFDSPLEFNRMLPKPIQQAK